MCESETDRQRQTEAGTETETGTDRQTDIHTFLSLSHKRADAQSSTFFKIFFYTRAVW